MPIWKSWLSDSMCASLTWFCCRECCCCHGCIGSHVRALDTGIEFWANMSSFIYAFVWFLLPCQFCQEDIPSFVARLAPQPLKAGSESSTCCLFSLVHCARMREFLQNFDYFGTALIVVFSSHCGNSCSNHPVPVDFQLGILCTGQDTLEEILWCDLGSRACLGGSWVDDVKIYSGECGF